MTVSCFQHSSENVYITAMLGSEKMYICNHSKLEKRIYLSFYFTAYRKITIVR